MPLHVGKGRTAGTAIAAIIDYVESPEKTDDGRLITSWQCDSRVADSEFLFSKQQYIRNTGRVRGADDVIAYHLRQSFRPGEITPEEANRLGCELARRFTKGKGAGYARWAKNFNLKQLSQTLIYLEENGLLDRGTLEEKAAAATSQYRTLSTDIKAKEQRMAEIKVMQQNIINYAKTRDVYVDYRKAGYSKKFLSEHESEIILHKAAKQFFDEQNLKKLPTVKSLQAEYAQLLSEKKAMYADYQKAREEMRSLQTAKANVDRILGEDTHTMERESEKEGR